MANHVTEHKRKEGAAAERGTETESAGTGAQGVGRGNGTEAETETERRSVTGGGAAGTIPGAEMPAETGSPRAEIAPPISGGAKRERRTERRDGEIEAAAVVAAVAAVVAAAATLTATGARTRVNRRGVPAQKENDQTAERRGETSHKAPRETGTIVKMTKTNPTQVIVTRLAIIGTVTPLSTKA